MVCGGRSGKADKYSEISGADGDCLSGLTHCVKRIVILDRSVFHKADAAYLCLCMGSRSDCYADQKETAAADLGDPAVLAALSDRSSDASVCIPWI